MLKDFILSQLQQKPQEPRLRFSQAGDECVRRVYYQATGERCEPPSDEGLVKMSLGTAFDQFALRSGGEWRCQVPQVIDIGGVRLTGTADAVLPKKHVADLKVVGEKTWARVQKAPDDKHRAQVMLYAFAEEAPTWSVCYVRASTGEMLEHFGETDPIECMELFGMFEEAKYYMLKGRPPPRPYMDWTEDDVTKRAIDRWPCKWCSFKEVCWEE